MNKVFMCLRMFGNASVTDHKRTHKIARVCVPLRFLNAVQIYTHNISYITLLLLVLWELDAYSSIPLFCEHMFSVCIVHGTLQLLLEIFRAVFVVVVTYLTAWACEHR